MNFTATPIVKQLASQTLPAAKQLALSLPAHFLKPITLMPSVVSRQLMNLSLNQAFKSALAEQELNFLVGNWLQLSITDVNFCSYITVIESPSGNIQIKTLSTLPDSKPKPDVEFSADANSLALLATKQVDPDTLFFQRKLLVTGNTELGLAIKNFLDDFDINESFPSSMQYIVKKAQAVLKTEYK